MSTLPVPMTRYRLRPRAFCAQPATIACGTPRGHPKQGTHCAARRGEIRDGAKWEREDGGRPLTGLLSGGQYGPTVTDISSGQLMLYVKASGDDARGLFAATTKDGRTWTSLSVGKST